MIRTALANVANLPMLSFTLVTALLTGVASDPMATAGVTRETGAMGAARTPGTAQARARGAGGDRAWPVAGPGARGRPVVLRGFEAPATPWAAGHRGVDLLAGPGTPVRAAAPGEVVFTGRVAGTPVVVLRIGTGLRITYEPVRATVPVGALLPAGGRTGLVEGAVSHCPAGCLHWGLLRGDTYLDPLSLLPPGLRRAGPSRLLPVYGAR